MMCIAKKKRLPDTALRLINDGRRLILPKRVEMMPSPGIMGLDRFTLRGKKKVDIQWNLFCIVHNLKKVSRYGSGFA